MESKNQPFSVYAMVSERIIMSLKNNIIPWHKPWVAPGSKEVFINYDSRKSYTSLLNKMLLGKPGEYLTFTEIQKHKGTIKKGSKATPVVFFKMFVPKDKKDEYDRLMSEGRKAEAQRLTIPILKYYNVFHIDDVDGIESKQEKEEHADARSSTQLADAVIDSYALNEGLLIDEKECDESSYDLLSDTVTIPLKTQFRTEEEWYNTLFGGLVRSTSKRGRLNREKSTGGEESANARKVKEELTTEMGASMLLSHCGLDIKEATDNTDAICKYWIDAMNRDLRLVVYASSAAQKAAEYVLGGFSETTH